MKTPKITIEKLKNHFAYSIWFYIVGTVLLCFLVSLMYNWTQYVPPREKSIIVNFVGRYVSQEFIDDLIDAGTEAFPEMESVQVYATSLDDVSNPEMTFAATQKLMMMIVAQESDIYAIDKESIAQYVEIGAFEPLDELVAPGGLLDGYFTKEEILEGTYVTEEYGTHVFTLPCDRFYSYYDYPVDPRSYTIALSAGGPNLEYAQQMVKLMADRGMAAERPEWLDELEALEEEKLQQSQSTVPIG